VLPAGLNPPARRGPLALVFASALVLIATGCGGANRTAGSSSKSARDASSARTAPAGGYVKLDGDADTDDERSRVRRGADEQPLLKSYGPMARPGVTRTIGALVRSYYAAAAAAQAARACSLLDATLAEGLATQPAQHGSARSCAGAISPLLSQQHSRFVAEDASTMTIVAVHVKGDLALAVLGFRTTPESQIVLQREESSWKIAALFGSYMP
jgi:hypothetical protein